MTNTDTYDAIMDTIIKVTAPRYPSGLYLILYSFVAIVVWYSYKGINSLIGGQRPRPEGRGMLRRAHVD